MKLSWLLFAMALACGPAIAQSAGTATPLSAGATNAPALEPDLHLSDRLTLQSPQPEVSLGKKLRARGPLISIFKPKKLSQVPRRVLHLVNPFAPVETAPSLERVENLSPRAWSATVGFHPGASAFPEATTHESSLSLISAGR